MYQNPFWILDMKLKKIWKLVQYSIANCRALRLLNGIVNFFKKSYPQISHINNIIQKFYVIFIQNLRDLFYVTLYEQFSNTSRNLPVVQFEIFYFNFCGTFNE